MSRYCCVPVAGYSDVATEVDRRRRGREPLGVGLGTSGKVSTKYDLKEGIEVECSII